MLLAIDIGNTNIALGVYTNGQWVHHWRVRTVRDKMADEYDVLFRALFREAELKPGDLDRVALCSVVPPLTGVISEMVTHSIKQRPLIIGPTVRSGLRIRTDNPAEVGADLVADAVAAYDRLRTNCIVVDFGTATTFTAVAAPGDLLGVAIAPGLETSAGALTERTSQLPRIHLQPPPSAIGRNTIHSMQAGLVYGHVGLVKELIDRISAEMGGKVQAIATGGLSGALAPLVGRFVAVDPWLTLDGVRLIAERNPE